MTAWRPVRLALLPCVFALLPAARAAGDTYPAQPFNGMQIVYTISGVSVSRTQDAEGFTTSRALEGTASGGEIRVSGSCRMGSGYHADAVVTVSAGSEQKSWSKRIPSGWPNFNSESFDVAVRVPAGAKGATVRIEMNGSYNAGGRGLVVAGSFTVPPRPSLTQTLGGLFGGKDEPSPTPTPSPSPPQVSLTVRPAAVAADGETTAEAVFRYVDDKGKPVGGVALEWRVGPRLAPEELGALVKSDATTGADGTARAVYKAPLLEARNMQEIGEQKGTKTATLTLLKTAPADLVVEKPGLPKSRVGIRIGSLNGTIRGTLLLRASHLPNSPVTSREAINDATVSIESPMLTWAAIEKATSDEKGRFAVAMKMTNWPRWDLTLREPVLLDPDEEFTARQKRLTSALGQWPASDGVKRQALDLASDAQVLLARLEAREAEGLAAKLQIAAWMLSLLKDGRGDAKTAAGELLGHGWSLVKTAGEYFYTDSALAKAVDEKYKHIEKAAGVHDLKVKKAKWIKSLADKSAVRDSLFAWLGKVVLSRAPSSSELESGGRFRRSLLDKVFLSKALEEISGLVAEKVTEQVPEGVVPDVGGFLTDKLLKPYDDAGNETVGLFLGNTDYERIREVSSGVEARLSSRKAAMMREFQHVTDWRIAEDMVQALAANASECTQAFLNVMAAGLGAPELAEAAKTLEKVHKALDAAATTARFAEECFTFSGILTKTADTVLDAASDAAGVTVRVTDRGAAPSRTAAARASARWELLPAVHAAEGPSFDLAGGVDWTAFQPREGRVPVEALGQLALLGPAVDDWRAGNLVPLLAVAESDPQGMAELLAREAEWREAVLAAYVLALQSLATPMGPAEEAAWAEAVKTLRERTDALQGRIDAAARAVERLGPDPDAELRKAIAEKQEATAAAAAPAAPAADRRWPPLAAAVGAIAAGLLGLGLVLWRVLGRRAGPAPAVAAPPAEAVAPLAVPGALVDARGRAYPLDRPCLTLGTAPDNDVVLPSRRASRHHARVWRTPEGTCWIEDLRSTNGTWVDGQRIERAWLQPGSLVALGTSSCACREEMG
jgi:hypothetical protein